MTCKVRRDFKIITDVISRVSLVTSNIRGSSICSPKSLYKKTSDEILAELKAVVKTGALKVQGAPTRHTPVCYNPSAVTGVCQTASSHTPRGREKKEHFELQWSYLNKNDCYIFSLTFEFEYFFFCGLLSLQQKTLVLWYSRSHLR